MVAFIRDFDDYTPPPPKPVYLGKVDLSPEDEDRMVTLAVTPAGDKLNQALAKVASDGLVQVLRMSASIGYDLAPALVLSAQNNDTKAVKTLLASGAFDKKHDGFISAYVFAAAKNNREIMALVDKNIGDDFLRQAGNAAGSNGANDAVSYLAEKLTPVSDDMRPTYISTLKAAFESAAAKGHNDTAKLALRFINQPPSRPAFFPPLR